MQLEKQGFDTRASSMREAVGEAVELCWVCVLCVRRRWVREPVWLENEAMLVG